MSACSKAGKQHDEVMWQLMIDDVHEAADVFRPVYEATDGADGFVSIEAGLPAIRHMIGEGKHTNVTLTFSVERYTEVVDAYLSGLEDLQKQAGDLHRVASVASLASEW